jgi:hypothetical protein
VKNLTVMADGNSEILINWTAPFSLEITQIGSEMGVISYCVEIHNSSSWLPLVSVCDLINTHYMYVPLDPPSPCDGVDVMVTPVNSVGNGSSDNSTGTFYNGGSVGVSLLVVVVVVHVCVCVCKGGSRDS